ncbi:hypothetical protein ACF0H5_009595 [Mactra antiquata]
MHPLTFIVILGAVCGALTQITDDPLCAGCVFVNGAAYNNHEDCTKFVQCRYNSLGKLIGTVRRCPFATYWDMNSLNCLPVEDTKCPNDFCFDKIEFYEHKAETNCRGYWQCNDVGKSVPMCCPANYLFDKTHGCIEDVFNVCNDTCFAVYEPPQPTICDKLPVLGKPDKYQQDIAGWGTMVRSCAPGTEFVAESCLCLRIVKPSNVGDKCLPEIHLTFEKDHTDQSKYPTTVVNENVDVKDGVAIFNGNNSRLIIPRFTNVEHRSTVIIRAKYKSSHQTFSGMARALVVNSDCGNLPSIMLSEDETNTYFGVSTNEKRFVFTYLPQKQVTTPQPEKYVEFRFENGQLWGSDGDSSRSVEAPGYLRSVRCALQIGYADNLLPFEGEIDELTIYLCDPDE